jgi:predicted secreted hydrolase
MSAIFHRAGAQRQPGSDRWSAHFRRLRSRLAWLYLCSGLLLGCQRAAPVPSSNPLEFLSGAAPGFERALAPIDFEFPRDHGTHDGFQSEWWYLTGHLHDDSAPKRHYGLQFTLFRQGLIAPDAARAGEPRTSPNASRAAYLTHVALADAQLGRLTAFERSSRGAPGLAGAEAEPTLAFLGPNRLEVTPDTSRGDRPTLRLSVHEPALRVELELTSLKALVRHGERGLSRKGALPGNASYYFSATRLKAQGWMEWQGQRLAVEGDFWLDREWSTSVLESDLLGWDWVSLQLDDGTELMAFVLLKQDGSLAAASSGTFIAADGSTQALGHGDFRLTTTATWQSPRTGQRYATGLELSVPGLALDLSLEALFPDQELDLPLSYFEGAFNAVGRRAEQAIRGQGYVEQVRGKGR